MDRRSFLIAGLSTPFLARPAFAAAPQIDVYKAWGCDCCTAWAEHLTKSGFVVNSREIDNQALWDLKERLGVTEQLSSCHTAQIDRYFVEGHVPAGDIIRLLDEYPLALGLAVPGMPFGSPGMEMGDEKDPYDTLLVLPGGKTEVFSSYS